MAALWFEKALLPDGWAADVRMTLELGQIATVEAGEAAQGGDERAAVGLPGLCNLHSHAFQRAMAGLVEVRGPTDDDFWSWRELMRFLARMTPDDIEAIAAQVYVEMLQGGFTRVGEFHYLHRRPDGGAYDDVAETARAIASATATAGIGLTLLPVYYAQGGFGGAPPKPGQRRFISCIDQFARLLERSREHIVTLPDARLGVAPHSLRAVGPEDLAAVVALRDGGPVHIHVAEQVREVADCIAWSGRPLCAGSWTKSDSPRTGAWCATHLDALETSDLAASGAVAGLCPITEANLGDGVFPAAAFLAAGGRFGVGGDSHVLVDAAQELRGLEYAQRLTRRQRNVLATPKTPSTGGRLFRQALEGGAQALGATTGLRPGAPADIVALDPDHPALYGRAGDALLDSWIFAGGAACVDRVWRRGVRLVDKGRHVAAGPVYARYRQVAARLLES